MVVLDASMLLLFLKPDTPGPLDASGAPLEHTAGRVEHLIAELDKSGEKVAVPTPALSEVLVKGSTEEAQQIVDTINRKRVFSVESFDQRAAIEVSVILRDEIGRRGLKGGPETWAKLKYDRQIVAIAQVCGATAIYSDDNGIHSLAERVGIHAYRVSDLEVPPEDLQASLFDRPEEPGVPSL